jgi:hypothetical protein
VAFGKRSGDGAVLTPLLQPWFSGKGHKKTRRVAEILETLEPAAEEATGKWLT